MSAYQVLYTHQARQDFKKLRSVARLEAEARTLLDLLARNPEENPPPFKKLTGELRGAISRRLNRQHRIVYQIFKTEQCIKVIRVWTHYGD